MNKTMKKLWFLSIIGGYSTLSVFFLIMFPLMFYVSSSNFPNSYAAKIKLPAIIYSVVVGVLYLISAIYVFKSKRIGLILGVIASLIGVFLVFPLAGLFVSGAYFFVKEEFENK
jgi:uncharacterized membrane protein YbhN (UPF0104 family)